MPKKNPPAKIKVTKAETPPAEIEVKTAPELPADLAAELEAKPAHDSEEAETSKIVGEIAAQESDDLLEAEDEKNVPGAGKQNFAQRLKSGLADLVRNPAKRRAVLVVLIIGLLATVITPTSRYFVLNNVGVRSSAMVTILDDGTQQPLKNVSVTLGDQTASTDKEGKVTFRHLRLGKTRLEIRKRAFATKQEWVTIGWGSNPLETISLKPVGSQYRFVVTDYLSGQPIDGVEAVSGEASALSDPDGKITLTLEDAGDAQTANVSIQAEGYRTENLTLDLDNRDETAVNLVPARSHLFISKRSGRYDVYKIDIDGQNEEKILSGSGIERDDLALVPHPTKDVAVLVSTRENVRQNGFLLSTLTLIDINTKTPSKLAQSERIQIIGWVGDRLIYVQIAAGASGEDPDRHQLMSYDLASAQTKQLAAANYFNDVLVAGSHVYYAPASLYAPESVAFYRIGADGAGKQTVVDQEVWNIYRTGYDKLTLAGVDDWFEYSISSAKATVLTGQPSNPQARLYINSPDNKSSLWLDSRDGKGVLLIQDIAAGSDKTLYERSGLTDPVVWLGNKAIVFRVSTNAETADYAVSPDGGEPKKITNVTDTSGLERWYYY